MDTLFDALCDAAIGLNAVVVGTPGGDGLLDLLGVEVFGYGASGEGGEFGVGGEAEGDVLLDGDGVDQAEVIFVEEVGEAELLFEADDAVLRAEGGGPGGAYDEEENHRHDDPPEVGVLEAGPCVDGRVDREGEVQQEQRDDDEVDEWVPAGVIFEGLRLRHRGQ